MAICTRENSSSFFNLQLMLLEEENHVGVSMSMHFDNKIVYTDIAVEADRHAMVATDKSRIKGIIDMSIVVPDLP